MKVFVAVEVKNGVDVAVEVGVVVEVTVKVTLERGAPREGS